MRWLALVLLLMPLGTAAQERLRVATWTVELTRNGPGLLLRDILKGDDPQIRAAQDHIRVVSPDILLLTGFDTDFDGHGLRAFAQDLDYPAIFTHPGNSGRPTGRDLDKDGRFGEPEDAQSYGEFTGQGGMALLSRLPIAAQEVRDFSEMLWRDLPEAALPEGYFDDDDLEILRLSSHAHWDVPVMWNGAPLHLFSYTATSPVFDGEEDRNGRRNADETRFWLHYLDGGLPLSSPEGDFVILGDSNLDPYDGDGRREVMHALLSDPRIQDPQPRAQRGPVANPGHLGDPALDTADWDDPQPGNLRVDYVLPSSGLEVLDAGVAWVDAANEKNTFRHGLVWVDLARLP
ncbi:endonuclease/exonuclease/phosphatase family protein [Celeribacter halophilus]|uniref:Endonuclease/Exonuclease/phosphatase family protein n=1 Tax=Celeribacter halophilus TaxID=576117 RepID=A0A1I3TY96_9RHOB|nr:endonuclease/exonuclease/phosphatase family protein [Celeribacter halophilus]SFJ75612.1 Endonuclease/Exonuclease/phosphatase family protein [Celeribacter halophilus]